MRSVQQPGPAAPQRHQVAPCQVTHQSLQLPSSIDLLQAMQQACAANGATSAVARVSGGLFEPLVYVMPALSPTPQHAAYYSETYTLSQPTPLQSAAITMGLRDGQPWLHCHGIWQDSQGQTAAGHILPNETCIAQPLSAQLTFVHGADFVALPCEETGFNLFQPVNHGTVTDGPQSAFVLTVRPNEDLCELIAQVCAARGVQHAVIHGGVGSLVGVHFSDGRIVEPFITEVFIEQGTITDPTQGGAAVQIDAALVDYTGGIHRGRLVPGANPVLMTFELVIEPIHPIQETAHHAD